MAASQYKLVSKKKNGQKAYPKTIVEAVFWDEKKENLADALKGLQQAAELFESFVVDLSGYGLDEKLSDDDFGKLRTALMVRWGDRYFPRFQLDTAGVAAILDRVENFSMCHYTFGNIEQEEGAEASYDYLAIVSTSEEEHLLVSIVM